MKPRYNKLTYHFFLWVHFLLLEKPNLSESSILSHLQAEFGLQGARVAFLPIGADSNTAVYRVDTADKTAYFLKLRKGAFSEVTVTLPAFLKTQGIRQIIAPLPSTRAGRLWGGLDDYTMVLYPFIEGKNAYEQAPSDRQWVDFGAALKGVHTVHLPTAISKQIPLETYSSQWRDEVKAFQAQAEENAFAEPVAAKLAAYMRARHSQIDRLVSRTEQLAQALGERPPEPVLCHSDIHAGNLHLCADNRLYIVDWDAPIFAAKELDLAMLGGSATWSSPREVALFYRGYGQADIDLAALEYYRCERIILDIADYGEQMFLSDEGGEDREQGYQYFTSNFLPGHEIELALNTGN
jgi:spectinomycin phosphotransferase